MKFTALLPLAATAAGLVLPDAQVFEQILVEQDGNADNYDHAGAAAWFEKLPSKDDILGTAEETVSDIWSDVDDAVSDAKDRLTSEFEALFSHGVEDEFDEDLDQDFDENEGPHHGPPGPPGWRHRGPPEHRGPPGPPHRGWGPPPPPPDHRGPPGPPHRGWGPPPPPPPHHRWGPPPPDHHGPPGPPHRGSPDHRGPPGPPRRGRPDHPRGPPRPPHHGPPPHRGHPPHEPSNKTIWELISTNEHTTKFAGIAGNYSDIVAFLNSTTHNVTLFVPGNKAFEHIPHHDDSKDSDEDKERLIKFIHASLQYHIVDGLYPARRLLGAHTLPTALLEPMLGGEPQRLRVQLGLRGIGLNFFTRVVMPNIPASNGVIHAVDHILVPPPFVGRELSLVPSVFSTLLLAYEKTKFVDFIHHVRTNGSTVFAPTNGAFARLGLGANAFLFNSPKGLKYLEALLKYQIVANETLYSDAVYKSEEVDGEEFPHGKKFTVDLPTLLHDIPVRVEVSRWAGFVNLRVNRFAKVVLKDGVAKNGVIQVVDHLPLPPCKHGKDGADVAGFGTGEISVEDLKARLEPYVEAEAEDVKEEQEMVFNPVDEL